MAYCASADRERRMRWLACCEQQDGVSDVRRVNTRYACRGSTGGRPLGIALAATSARTPCPYGAIAVRPLIPLARAKVANARPRLSRRRPARRRTKLEVRTRIKLSSMHVLRPEGQKTTTRSPAAPSA